MTPNVQASLCRVSSSASSGEPGSGGSRSTQRWARSRQASKRSAGSASSVDRRTSLHGGGAGGVMASSMPPVLTARTAIRTLAPKLGRIDQRFVRAV